MGQRVGVFLFVVLMGVSATGSAPDLEPDALSRYRLISPSKTTLDSLAEEFEIVGRKGADFEVLVPPSRAPELFALDPRAQLLKADVQEEGRHLLATWGAGYHTLSSVKTDLDSIVKAYPTLAQLEKYGESEDGNALYALKVSDNVDKSEAEPQVMLTAATHGDELITVEVLFGLIRKLLENHGKDSRLTSIVDGLEITFIPVVNPDGYSHQTRYSNGVDPNRDYPVPGKPTKRSNACIQELRNFVDKHLFVGSIDFHSFAEMVMYPWAYTADDLEMGWKNAFENLTKAMSKTNGYQHGQISQILYPAPGSSADYYLANYGMLSLGIEIGKSNVPSTSSIPSLVDDQAESTWIFLQHFL